MSLSIRTKKVLEIQLRSKKYAKEVIDILDIVPSAGVAAQFIGQVAGMTTDVTIDADVAGLAGNITLVADSIKDIDTLIADWNLANAGNEVTLSAGDGSQIPTADIVLAGGVDAVLAGGVLSEKAKKIIRNAFCDNRSYKEFVSAVESAGTLSYRSKKVLNIVMCDKRSYEELVQLF